MTYPRIRDVSIESGVIALGSVGRVLDGKPYKTTIQFHKLNYEICLGFISKEFFEWLTEVKPAEIILDNISI